LVKFEICNDDSEIANISCKNIVFLQDFVNFKTFFEKTKAQKRLKEEIKDAELYEGKFVLILMYCLLYPRADGAKSRARVLIPPGYLHPGKGKH
jgi:hypothetical protein